LEKEEEAEAEAELTLGHSDIWTMGHGGGGNREGRKGKMLGPNPTGEGLKGKGKINGKRKGKD